MLATGSRLPLPGAAAFTIGDVVHTPETEPGSARPRLLAHEERHSWQYAACLGLPMVPLYGVAAGWSYLRGGDPAVHNAVRALAGLEDGGYPTGQRSRRGVGLSARRRRRTGKQLHHPAGTGTTTSARSARASCS